MHIARTRVYRREGRPFFIDKMPNNFHHIGLIQMILPNAKIIDARRHPLACCLSGFKQHFALGQQFTYSLADLGHYYADYVRLMAHFDSVLPGRVHRVIYEQMVADPERETRAVARLLAACRSRTGACASTRTAAPCAPQAPNRSAGRSSRDGLEGWRAFEPWLGPLKEALGAPVLATS